MPTSTPTVITLERPEIHSDDTSTVTDVETADTTGVEHPLPSEMLPEILGGNMWCPSNDY